jgi:hypothetical protein
VFQQEMLDIKVEMAAKVDAITRLEDAEAALNTSLKEFESKHKKLDDEHFELLRSPLPSSFLDIRIINDIV